MKPTPSGSRSSRATPLEVPGRVLVTVIVYVSVPPAATGSGASAIAIARSAGVSTIVDAFASLLDIVGSAVPAPTLALVAIAPPDGGVVTRTAIDGAAPTSRAARVQVTSCPLA